MAVRVQEAVAKAPIGTAVSICGGHVAKTTSCRQVFFDSHKDSVLCESWRVVVLISH